MKFRPLHDRVVVKRIDAEEKSAGGIIIPDTAKEKPSDLAPFSYPSGIRVSAWVMPSWAVVAAIRGAEPSVERSVADRRAAA